MVILETHDPTAAGVVPITRKPTGGIGIVPVRTVQTPEPGVLPVVVLPASGIGVVDTFEPEEA